MSTHTHAHARQQQKHTIIQTHGAGTHAVQHAHDVFGVRERADLLETLPVDDGERLQTQALHGDFGREQEAVVELVEELVPEGRRSTEVFASRLTNTNNRS